MNYLYLTPEDKDKVEIKIDLLKHEKELFSRKLGEAAAHGGSFPQGIPEYVVLENKIHRLEDEMILLKKILDEYEIIEIEKLPKNIITTYSNVKAENNENITTFQIIESIISKEKDGIKIVSPKSPVGSAFLGKKKGEVAKVNLPQKNEIYKILEIN